MLVLTRHEKESIKIGDNVIVNVVKITRGKVTLGIEAPKNITVLRSEIAHKYETPNFPSLEQ
jgi:carbon storage regulator